MSHKTPDEYFILIYDVQKRNLEIEPFRSDFEAAADMYGLLEERHRDDRDVEVVLVGADGIETIKRTHSHYFAENADDVFRAFLEELGTPAAVSN